MNQPPDVRLVPAPRLPDDPGGPPTEVLSAMPEPDPERSSVSVRIAILVGILATIMLSGLVWAVNRRAEPHITALPVDPPSLSDAATAAIDVNGTPSGPALTVSPTGSIPATIVPGPSLNPSGGSGVPPSQQPGRPATAAPPPPVPTRTPTHAPTTPARTTAATVRLTASFQQVANWPSGYQGRYTITNRGIAAVHGWTVVVTFSRSATIAVWDARPSTGSNGKVTFTDLSYNATVSPGASVTFAFNVTGSPPPTPTGCTVNGTQC
jgi:hypothetical protein